MKKIVAIIVFVFLFQNGSQSQCFTVGADLSYTNSVLAHGGIYRDASYNVINPYLLFAQKGANMVRMRLWHTPSNIINSCGNPITENNITDVIQGFQQAKLHGMKLNLAIHYGDYFNDPNTQKRPQAWMGLSHAVLLDSIYNYTFSTLEKLRTNAVTPDIVAVGNETTWGFIDATATTNGWTWPEDADKFNIAFTAIDNFNGAHSLSVKKALHFTDSTAAWLAGLFNSNNVVNFDMIGLSFYPVWSNFTSLQQFGNLVTQLHTTYNKEIMVFETGVPWTTASGDNYNNIINSYGNLSYPITPIGQKNFFSDLSLMVYNSGGTGVLYWEPGYISSTLCDKWGQGSSYENMSFFNFTASNTPLPVFDVFNFCANLAAENPEIATPEIVISPNPTSNTFSITGMSTAPKSIRITDCLGRSVKNFDSNQDFYDISDLHSGVYFITFSIENKTIVKRIVKE
jgi:arabinogalactan endo-1,4-beta-galactosidase